MIDAAAAAKDLAATGVAGVQIAWADNNGIPRSRVVPVESLADVAERGVGVTSLFAVFDSHDGITFAYPGLANASGDVRLVPVLEGLQPLPGQPALAWAPGRQVADDGSVWPYDQRGALERQVRRAADLGYEIRAGYELEFAICPAGSTDIASSPGHHGPAYSPQALLEVDEFVAALLRDAAGAGLRVHQLHAEYGLAQVELSLVATDPVSAADEQLLARQVIKAAARAHGLRVSFAPLVTPDGVGNGWHLHTSVSADGRNLLAGDQRGPGADGAGYLAGLLRDLPALTAVTVPSVPSSMRLRPGYFASAYRFWGVQNREAPLRYVPGSDLLGAGHANVELKPSDASANPYLALAAVIACGVAGLTDKLELTEPIADEPSGWSAEDREKRGIQRLPSNPAEQAQALSGNTRITEALGEDLLGAFRAVRAADATWAAERSPSDVVAAHLWKY
jgi:glutamine synthetase